jgi:transcriptional regulator with XRE-family HTH domain
MLSPVKIGHHIRQLREARDYSQDYMADRLEISQSAYANIENGKVHLRVDRLYEIATILQVPPLRLLDELHEANHVSPPVSTRLPATPAHDQLIHELKSEIAFLRQIVALQERRK